MKPLNKNLRDFNLCKPTSTSFTAELEKVKDPRLILFHYDAKQNKYHPLLESKTSDTKKFETMIKKKAQKLDPTEIKLFIELERDLFKRDKALKSKTRPKRHH